MSRGYRVTCPGACGSAPRSSNVSFERAPRGPRVWLAALSRIIVTAGRIVSVCGLCAEPEA